MRSDVISLEASAEYAVYDIVEWFNAIVFKVSCDDVTQRLNLLKSSISIQCFHVYLGTRTGAFESSYSQKLITRQRSIRSIKHCCCMLNSLFVPIFGNFFRIGFDFFNAKRIFD